LARILIADDEPKLGALLVEMLEARGHDVLRASGGKEALARLAATTFDVVLTDLRMPHVDGLSVLREARRCQPATDVVIMTAFATTESAVEAMREGAVDYLIKPFAMDELQLRIERVLGRRARSARAEALARRLDEQHGFRSVSASSPRMQMVLREAERVAVTDETVLLLGESGVGKTAIARAIHHGGHRAAARLVEVHCSALPESLIESELFGHEKGAFTGAHENKRGHVEAADGGTLFLDEIGEIPAPIQVKLLRFLQDRVFTRVGSTTPRRVDVRVLAATNRDLERAMRAGHFREDLYYRLSVFPILVPPLRERPEDVQALAFDVLRRRGVPPDHLTGEALQQMRAYTWPGNVRELENVLARALILAGGAPIGVDQLTPAVRGQTQLTTSLDDVLVPGFSLDRFARDLIHHAIARAGGNKASAARTLGITRRRLYSMLKSLEDPAPETGEHDPDPE
jgi:DNA-binding NtrC family response regulator